MVVVVVSFLNLLHSSALAKLEQSSLNYLIQFYLTLCFYTIPLIQ